MLTLHRVTPFLLERNLLEDEYILDREFAVTEILSRNRNFRVFKASGPSYVVKQAIDLETMATLTNEAGVYQMLAQNTEFAGLNAHLPRYFGFDSGEYALIIELLPAATDLRAEITRTGHFGVETGVAMAKTLAALHRAGTEVVGMAPGAGRLEPCAPWVLSMHRPDLDLFRHVSVANLALVRIVQQAEALCQELDDLRTGWAPECLIHNDIKWDNWVIPEDGGGALKLVDWELAMVGDPAWDTGCVFGSYLASWLSSIPITGEQPPERFASLAAHPLESMQPAIQAFWRTYASARGLEASANRTALFRSARYAAARLVQAAYEQMQMTTQLTSTAILMLQLSVNIIRRPHEAIVHLLGVPLGLEQVA
jgi:aminoglycoside phosphotransferase (APT) family kinase protein